MCDYNQYKVIDIICDKISHYEFLSDLPDFDKNIRRVENLSLLFPDEEFEIYLGTLRKSTELPLFVSLDNDDHKSVVSLSNICSSVGDIKFYLKSGRITNIIVGLSKMTTYSGKEFKLLEENGVNFILKQTWYLAFGRLLFGKFYLESITDRDIRDLKINELFKD